MDVDKQSCFSRARYARTFLRQLLLLVSLVSFFIFSAGSVFAAVVPPVKEPDTPPLIFKHVLPTQIAAIGYITSIAQDTQGFMWFGAL